MATTKSDVEKFAGKNDFGIQRLKMQVLLVTQDLDQILGGEKAFQNKMFEA